MTSDNMSGLDSGLDRTGDSDRTGPDRTGPDVGQITDHSRSKELIVYTVSSEFRLSLFGSDWSEYGTDIVSVRSA